MYYSSLDEFATLFLALRTSTVAIASGKVTMVTFTRNLPLLSSGQKGLHFLLFRMNKLDRDFLHWQTLSLVCPLRNHVTSLLSHQSLSECKDGGWWIRSIRSMSRYIREFVCVVAGENDGTERESKGVRLIKVVFRGSSNWILLNLA